MKQKLFVLLPVVALLVAGVTPVVAQTVSNRKVTAQHFAVKPPQDSAERDQKLASVLGISIDDLKSRLTAGKTPEQIATDLGMSQADFQKKMHDAMIADFKAHLASNVTAGKITQTEADAKLAQMQTDIANGKFPMGPGMMHGGRGHFKNVGSSTSAATTK